MQKISRRRFISSLILVAGFLIGTLPFAAMSQENRSVAEADGKFSIAIYPDTQMEVFESFPALHGAVPTTRFRNRSQWLVDNKDKFDLRFVLHTGDMVNWEDDREQSQY